MEKLTVSDILNMIAENRMITTIVPDEDYSDIEIMKIDIFKDDGLIDELEQGKREVLGIFLNLGDNK